MLRADLHRISGKEGGIVLLELVVVVAILLLLTGGYLSRGGGLGGSTKPGEAVNRAEEAACLANRAALRTTVEIYVMESPRGPITHGQLKAKGHRVPTCPGGGAYGWTREGNILCSVHGGN